ncbi:MAG: hypothetical protein IPP49_12950 [Saprospiraceae bacterium]|nr:hypothetical protein [Saprospiraceae bacterium]
MTIELKDAGTGVAEQRYDKPTQWQLSVLKLQQHHHVGRDTTSRLYERK